jgi:hypothetical protein
LLQVDYLIPFENFAEGYDALREMSSLRKLPKSKINAKEHPHWCDLMNTSVRFQVCSRGR